MLPRLPFLSEVKQPFGVAGAKFAQIASLATLFAWVWAAPLSAQIWINPLTTGAPIGTYYLGDSLSSTYYVNLEIGQDWWNYAQIGFGTDINSLNWAVANWYEDVAGSSNKRVRRDIGNWQFTTTGDWGLVFQAKAYSGDSYTTASVGGWTNGTTYPTNFGIYFTVSALNDPTSLGATNAGAAQIDLSWVQGVSGTAKSTMIVRSTDTNFTAPAQGTAYTVGNTNLGGDTVVYNGSGTSFSDTGLDGGTAYHYKFYAENYSFYSPGGTASATTTGTPTITVSGLTNDATTSAFTTTYGTPSAAQSFTIGGSNLTTNIVATAPTGFQVSTNDSSYTNTVTFAESGGTASGTLYMRLSATADAGSYDSVSVTLASTNAATRSITTPASGNTVSKATPTIDSAPTASSAIIKGDKLTNSLLSGGSASTAGAFSFDDTATEQTASGSKDVTFTPTDTTNYNTVATSVSVTVDPVPDPTNVGATASGTTSIALTHDRTSNRNVMIVRRAGSAVDFTPADDTDYSNGQDVGNGHTVVKGSLDADTSSDTGLSPSTTYHYKIFSENWGWYSAGVTASATTDALPPTITVAGSPSAMTTDYGTASAAESFTVAGSSLTADLTVTAPAGFEVSESSGSGYASSVVLTPSSGSVATTTVYVRLKANASPGANSGDVTASSTGATSQTVAVSGTVSVASMTMTVASSAGTLNADYTTTKLFADEVAGTTNNVTITFSPGLTPDEVEVWTNLNQRERANDDANSDGIPDGIVPPDPPTDKPDGYSSGAYPTDGYFQAHPMSGSAGTYTLTINANKTGAYRLTARYRMTGGPWVYYNNGGKRDHAITVSPILSRQMQVYEANVLNINATGSTFETRSTFEDLTDTNSSRVNLDYLRDLGANTVWFQPIHPAGVEGREAPGGEPYDPGSPYAVKNFFEVMEVMTDNYNGTNSSTANRAAAMSAFANFVAAADARGVNIMLDAPFNHTAHDCEIGADGIALMAAAGVNTDGWAATDKIKDREARFYSKNDSGSEYSGPASSSANVAVAPDRNDFGKWNDVIDVFFGRYSALVTGNPTSGSALTQYKSELDAIELGDLTGGANSDGAVTRAVWQYFASYVPYWLEQTGLAAGSSLADQTSTGIDGLRADFGQGMPPQFWEYVINVAREHKWNFVFMSESLDGGEVTYRSNRHFDVLNENIVFPFQSASNTSAYRTIFEDRRTAYGQGLVLLNNTSHDEVGYADPWQAFIRYAVGSTIDGAPMIMYGQEIGTSDTGSFDHYETNLGKSIPHFKRYNSMNPQWTAWASNAYGAKNLIPAYAGVGQAREFSGALKSSNRWFLNPINTVSADENIFAVAKYETANASPASSDVVLAFVNVTRSNNVDNTFGIPSSLATLLGLESDKLYNVKNIAAYLGPNNEYPDRRNTFLWGSPRTGADIVSNGIYVSLNGVPATDEGWSTNPHEAQYLKVYAAPGITTGGSPSAVSVTYGSASTNTSFTFSAEDVHDGVTVAAPAGFEVSTNSSTGFAGSISMTNTGTIAETTVYARLAATTAAGSYSGNVTISSPGGNSATVALPSSTVNAKSLTATFTAANKTYDGTTAATVSSSALDGVVGDDSVSLSGGSANFSDADVGTNKTVTWSGPSLAGDDAGNYTLASVASTTADITAAPLPDTTLTPVGDGSYTASADGVSGWTYSYSGRSDQGVTTSYGPSSSAPTAPGMYTVTATAPNYSGSASTDYAVTGPLAADDAVLRPSGNTSFEIPHATLLGNDKRIVDTSGTVATDNLSVTAVAAGTGSPTVTTSGVFVTFTAGGSGTETFTYTLYDAASGKSTTGEVTVTPHEQVAPFSIVAGSIGTPVYNGRNTSVSMVFSGTAHTTYYLYYKGELSDPEWKSVGGIYSETGTFNVTIQERGDHADNWAGSMFFQVQQ